MEVSRVRQSLKQSRSSGAPCAVTSRHPPLGGPLANPPPPRGRASLRCPSHVLRCLSRPWGTGTGFRGALHPNPRSKLMRGCLDSGYWDQKQGNNAGGGVFFCGCLLFFAFFCNLICVVLWVIAFKCRLLQGPCCLFWETPNQGREC